MGWVLKAIAVWAGYALLLGGFAWLSVIRPTEHPVLLIVVPLALWVVVTKIMSRCAVPRLWRPDVVTHATDDRGRRGITKTGSIRGTSRAGKPRARAVGELLLEGRHPKVWVMPKAYADAKRYDRCGALIGGKGVHALQFRLLPGETVSRVGGCKDVLLPWQLYVRAEEPLDLEDRDAEWFPA